MRRKMMYIFVFLLLLTISSLIVVKIQHRAKAQISPINLEGDKSVVHAAPQVLSSESKSTSHNVSIKVVSGDARPHMLRKFLDSHKSPMTEFADKLVAEADKNGFDYRLTTAIAMCESNAGKRMPSRDSYNAFGISVYTGQNFGAKFRNWDHSITWVSDYIRKRYYDQGLIDLIDIGQRWAPPSVEKGNSWAFCVQRFIDRII